MLDKKRKYSCLIWAGILLNLLFFSILVFYLTDGSKLMGMKVIDSHKLQKMKESKPVVSTESIDSWIRFNGKKIPYEHGTNTFYVSQNMNEDYWSGEFTSEDKDSRLVVVWDEFFEHREDAVKEGHTFQIYLEKDDYVVECRVIFSGLPVLSVEKNRSLLYNPYDHEIHNYSIKETVSRYYINDSGKYTLKLFHDGDVLESNAVSYLDLGKNSEWKLVPLEKDNSALRSSAAISLWNYIGAETEEYFFKVKADYAEVLIEGQYMGLFLIMWPQEPKEIELKEGDYLYKCKETLLDSDISALIAQEEIELEGRREEITLLDWEPLHYENGDIDVDNYINFSLYHQLVYDAEGLNRKKYLLAQKDKQGGYHYYRIPSSFINTFGLLSSKYAYYTEDFNEEISQRVLEDWELQRMGVDNSMLCERWQELRAEGLTTETFTTGIKEQKEYLKNGGVFVRNNMFGEQYCEEVIQFVENRFRVMDELYEYAKE